MEYKIVWAGDSKATLTLLDRIQEKRSLFIHSLEDRSKNAFLRSKWKGLMS